MKILCHESAIPRWHTGQKVEFVADPEAHRNRWLLKTWNVDRIEDHAAHLMPGRINTSDE